MKCSEDFSISNPTNQAYLMATGACALAVTIWMVGMRLKQEPITLQAKLICAGVVIAPPTIRMAQIAIQHLRPDSLTPEQEESEKEFPGKRINWDNINKLAPALKKALPDTPGHPCFEELLTQLESVTGLKEKTVAALSKHVHELRSNPGNDQTAANFTKRFILLLRGSGEDVRREAFMTIESSLSSPGTEISDAIQQSALVLCSNYNLTIPNLPPEPFTTDLRELCLPYLTETLWEDLNTLVPSHELARKKQDLLSFILGTVHVMDVSLPQPFQERVLRVRNQYQRIGFATQECAGANPQATNVRELGKAQAHYYLKHITAYLSGTSVEPETAQRSVLELADKLLDCEPSWTEAAGSVAGKLYFGQACGEDIVLGMARNVRWNILVQYAQRPPEGQKDWGQNTEGHWHRAGKARSMLGWKFGFDPNDQTADVFEGTNYGKVDFSEGELLKYVQSQYTVLRLANGIANQLAMFSPTENMEVLKLLQDTVNEDPYQDKTLLEPVGKNEFRITSKAVVRILEGLGLVKDITV